MTIQSTKLRPGLLVSLKTSIRGNVSYERRTVERAHTTKTGAEKESWETERTVADPAEFERAKRARNEAAGRVRSVCAHSAFGLLCPESKIDELAAAIAEAREIVDKFNRKSELSNVSVYVITGRVAADDVEAVRAINSEVRELLETMAKGVKDIDVDAIRAAANKARQLGSMLSPEAEARVKIAIDTARDAARKIVKAGETASAAIDKSAARKITEMRTTFLDLDDDAIKTQRPTARGRGVDLQA